MKLKLTGVNQPNEVGCDTFSAIIMSTKHFGIFLALGLLACRAYAYGPPGHELVGAIAEEKLAGKPVGKKIKQMLLL